MKHLHPLISPLLLLCLTAWLCACEPAASHSSAANSQNAPRDQTATKKSLATPQPSATSSFLSAGLSDNPWEALTQLPPEQLQALRQAMLNRQLPATEDAKMRRIQNYLFQFLRTSYYSMLNPGGARSSKRPTGAQHIRLRSHDGLSLQASYLPAAKKTHQAVILLHGYASNQSHTWVKYGHLSAEYNLLLLDLRGHNSQAGEVTLGVYETRDLQVAIRWLQGQGQRAFALLGESLGAAVAISGGAIWASGPGQQSFPLKAVWSDAAYADLRHAIAERAAARMAYEAPKLSPSQQQWTATLISDLCLSWLARDTGVQDVEAVAPIRQLPALVRHASYAQVHSSEDAQTSYANAQLLESVARAHASQALLFWATTGEHVDSWHLKGYKPKLQDFLKQAFAGG